jgi:hypothetical protein
MIKAEYCRIRGLTSMDFIGPEESKGIQDTKPQPTRTKFIKFFGRSKNNS